MSQEAAMFNDWASRMDAAYSPFNVYEDFKVAEEAKMIEDRRDDLMSYISDAHKDAYGFRPTYWDLSSKSIEELEAIADRMTDAVCDAIQRQRLEEEEALRVFEKEVSGVIDMGAGDRETAIRWIVEGLDMGGYATAEYACYNLGLSYKCAGMFDGILPREFA
jgi:hypothetical protein